MEQDLKKIVWLASYPKSGNTWFRVFLSNLLSEKEEPADINKLITDGIASSRSLFDEVAGVASSDLTKNEIEELRPEIFRQMAKNATETLFFKVHDAWSMTPSGKSAFPEEITKAVLYFIRNPLDVAVSFAFHNQTKPKEMIQRINDTSYAFCKKEDRVYNQFMQPLYDWSGHVKSWVHDSGLPVHVIRYEDMLKYPFATFEAALSVIGIEKEDAIILKAIENSRIEKLREMEENDGFSEKPLGMKSFFRKGEEGDWRNYLKEKQIKELVKRHREYMLKYGYLE